MPGKVSLLIASGKRATEILTFGRRSVNFSGSEGIRSRNPVSAQPLWQHWREVDGY